MLVAVALGLMLAPGGANKPAPVSIYVGPRVQDGFADVDRGLLDSIEDIRKALRKQDEECPPGSKRPLFPWSPDCRVAWFRIVEDESAADLKLYVLDRGHGPARDAALLHFPGTSVDFPGTTTTTRIGGSSFTTTTPGTTITSPGMSVAITSKLTYVVTVLRVGSYERPFVAEGQDARWRQCASMIAKDIVVWVSANRDRIAVK